MTLRGFTVGRFAVDSASDSKVDSGSRFSEVLKSTKNRFSWHTQHLDRVMSESESSQSTVSCVVAVHYAKIFLTPSPLFTAAHHRSSFMSSSTNSKVSSAELLKAQLVIAEAKKKLKEAKKDASALKGKGRKSNSKGLSTDANTQPSDLKPKNKASSVE